MRLLRIVSRGGHQLRSVYNFAVRTFERPITLKRFGMDLTPVTNAQFARFLEATDYRPRHPENFLKHWVNHAPPPGLEDHPVVYVDLGDARAYARWTGKRLPTEEEWQYAAQGPEGSTVIPGATRCFPNAATAAKPAAPLPSIGSPRAAHRFGILDLCGNTWEWTESEYTDGRTRFVMIRGGSFYAAKGSGWYMDGGPRPTQFSQKVSADVARSRSLRHGRLPLRGRS